MAAAQQFWQRIGDQLEAVWLKLNPFAEAAPEAEPLDPEKKRLITLELERVCPAEKPETGDTDKEAGKEASKLHKACMEKVAECGQILQKSTIQHDRNGAYLDASDAVVEKAKSCIDTKLNRR